MMTKIYFAHSKRNYNSEYEKWCLENIKEQYPNYEIINPKDIKIENSIKSGNSYVDFMNQMRLIYFPIIKTCDILIAFPTLNDKLTSGVNNEIKYAQENNIEIILFDISEFKCEHNKRI